MTTNPKLRRICLGLENAIIIKVLKMYKRNPCLWDTSHKYYHNKPIKNAAWETLLQTWRKCQPRATLHDVKIKIFHMRTNYTRQRRKVESSAGVSVHYEPTLWYYKHLNFLSGKKDTDSDDSDSDHNDETVYVQLPRGLKGPPSTSTNQDGEPEQDQEEDPASSVDASAAAFGRSVGAQLHHLSKMQRCIAEKLISDVIYHAKMEQLTLDTSINIKEAVEDQAATLIPKAGPSWYDTDLDNGAQESSFSCPLPTDTTEDLVRREMEETQSAVNFIKMESNDTESYVFHDDVDELSHAIDIVKEELM